MKKIPLRTCIASKEKLDKRQMFRIVKNKEGEVFIDDTLKANGRGVYLKKEKDIINKAKEKDLLSKCLEINVDKCIYDELLKRL